MPVDKRNHYSGTYQNGITSERYYHMNINEILKKQHCGVHSKIFVGGQSKLCILGQGLASNGTLLLQFSSYTETAGWGHWLDIYLVHVFDNCGGNWSIQMKSIQMWGEHGNSTHPNLPNQELNSGCANHCATLPSTTVPGWIRDERDWGCLSICNKMYQDKSTLIKFNKEGCRRFLFKRR